MYKLKTGCQWSLLPIESLIEKTSKIKYGAIFHHFRRWCKDDSFKKVWENLISKNKTLFDLSILNLDGTHSYAKRGGEEVFYQYRKKGKTTNIIYITDNNGYVIGTTKAMSGNHHDSYNMKEKLSLIFKSIKNLNIDIKNSFFNADSAFDTKDIRKVCFNHKLIPNIDKNPRNNKFTKAGRKKLFDKTIYSKRFNIERSNSWVDSYRSLLVRFEKKVDHWMGFHYLAFSMLILKKIK